MRLISLELHGFKSFADPQKLTFPGGMTAVVGPNGCGKSNISDSLAWVLGEQRASLLRGTEMSDVIFAGTSTRKPMGMAEVKLLLEMPDPALPGAFKEVVLSRRIHRNEGSEYRINGREARLKDVQDMLMDTGMGTRAYSFIQQGQIDLILSTKPKDRRQLLEEAAGITRYKVRRQEAERRLEDTKGNLNRLDDILHELTKQLESLRRQASKARRAMELDEEIKKTQRVLLAGKAEELEKAKARILDQLDALERGIATLTAQASEKASEVEGMRHAVDELNAAQARRARSVMALDQKLGLLAQEKDFQDERRREAAAQQQRLAQRRGELEARLGEESGSLGDLEARLKQAGGLLEAREEVLAEAEEAVALAQGALRRLEDELQALRNQRMEAQKAAAARQKQRLGFQAQIAQLEGRLEALNHEESVRAPRLEGLQAEAGQLSRQLQGLDDQVEEADEAVRLQRSTAQSMEDAQRAQAKALQEAQAGLEAAERRLRQLGDLLSQGSGDAELQKGLQWLKVQGFAPTALAEALVAEEAVRPDVERLLGRWVQAVAGAGGLAARLPEAQGQLLLAFEGESEAPDAPGGCEPLRAQLRWRGAAHPLRALLDRAFRCTDEALPALAAAHPGLAFVSPKLVRLPYGPVQAGAAAPAASPLKLRAELDAARAERETHLEKVEDLEASQSGDASWLAEARERLREMEEDLRALRLRQQSAKGQQASVQAQLQEITAAQERADALWEQLEGEIGRLRATLRELDQAPEEAQDLELDDAILEAEGRVRGQQAALEERRELRLESARSRDAAWSERDALQRQLQLAQRGRFEAEQELKRVDLEVGEWAEREQAGARRLEELEAEAQENLKERESLVAQSAVVQPMLEESQERCRVAERQARELQQALENARSAHQEVLIHGAQVQGSGEALAKEVELALRMELPEFLASVSEEEREAWAEGELVHQTRYQELQSRRLELGSVNPLAIQELAEAEERLGFMNQQRADVMEAIANLESTIQEINATSEERFREAFDYVNVRFGEVFRDVFGGGHAHLTLQDPKDLLECGIEITAQPPGKAPKSLTLLSGGEKALTAISLLFAIFHFKPSPFCVLDEVDAPLDEANVGRFANLVKRMKEETQFIVITHQKPTMVASDTLYGVTQEEPGVSKLVSVQLREAEQLV